MEENRAEGTRDTIPAPSTDSDAPITYPKARILIPLLILLQILASIISGSIVWFVTYRPNWYCGVWCINVLVLYENKQPFLTDIGSHA